MASENGVSGLSDERAAPAVPGTFKPSSLIREYRIPLPLTTEEYNVAQLYAVAEASKNETGGGEGVEIIENRPITDEEMNLLPFKDQLTPDADGKKGGQYTHKRFHLSSKVPSFVRILAPTGALVCDERAWNCFPYVRTEWTNQYMADNLHIVIETMHQDDNGCHENALNLSKEDLKKRKIVNIDIANDPVAAGDYKEEEDATKFHSEKTGRGPLIGKDWATTQEPIMCCYKLYRILFKWKLLQNRVENLIVNVVRRILSNFNRQLFCWIDKWHGMTMEDIRGLEAKTETDLNNMRKEGEVRGTKES